jgi:hypothetical protein
MSEEPSDFIKAHPISQPRRGSEMSECMGMEASMGWQPGFSTQPVEDLNEVPLRQWLSIIACK